MVLATKNYYEQFTDAQIFALRTSYEKKVGLSLMAVQRARLALAQVIENRDPSDDWMIPYMQDDITDYTYWLTKYRALLAAVQAEIARRGL